MKAIPRKIEQAHNMRDQGPQTAHHCDIARQPCATPWECCNGQSCRISPLQQANSDGSASGRTIGMALLSNFIWWLKRAALIIGLALVLGMVLGIRFI